MDTRLLLCVECWESETSVGEQRVRVVQAKMTTMRTRTMNDSFFSVFGATLSLRCISFK